MKFRHVVLLMALIFNICKKARSAGVRECYQCRSDLDERCLDVKTDMFLRVCDRNATTHDMSIDSNVCQKMPEYFCRKTVQKLFFLGEPKIIVLRECSHFLRVVEGKDRFVCTHNHGVERFSVDICECELDGCNGSTRTRTLSSAWFTALILLLTVFVHLKLSIASI